MSDSRIAKFTGSIEVKSGSDVQVKYSSSEGNGAWLSIPSTIAVGSVANFDGQASLSKVGVIGCQMTFRLSNGINVLCRLDYGGTNTLVDVSSTGDAKFTKEITLGENPTLKLTIE